MGQAAFDFERAQRAKESLAKADHLKRVSRTIKGAIFEFVSAQRGAEFHGDELTHFVCKRTGCSATSPLRILRDARKKGWLYFADPDRAKSLYRVFNVKPFDAWKESAQSTDRLLQAKAKLARLDEKRAETKALIEELERER